MQKYLEVKLIENKTDEKVIAEVTLIKKPDIEYDTAILDINGQPKGKFGEDGKLLFQPSDFGNIDCEIVFFRQEAEIGRHPQNIDLNISSWFAAAHPDLGHPLTIAENGKNIELFSRDRARGNNDICFRMIVRVPADEELTIDHIITKQTDPRAKYNQSLEVHYRGVDYKDRNDLYTPPDEAMFHIDSEKKKWQSAPITLGHGIHILYVVPSQVYDMSHLVVSGVSKEYKNDDKGSDELAMDYGFAFSFSGFFKTIF
jgi:hypothetical protein